MDTMAFETENATAYPATNFQDASTTPQPPIVLAMNLTDTIPYQSSVEPKADEESGTVRPVGSSQSNTETEIRELD